MKSGSTTKRAVIAVSIVTILLVVVAIMYGDKPEGSGTQIENIDAKTRSCEPDNGAIVLTPKPAETRQLLAKETSEHELPIGRSSNELVPGTVVVEPLAPTADIPRNVVKNKTENTVKYSYVAKPSIDWDADEEVYRAIVEEDERQGKRHIGYSDPQLKLSMKFAQWRGRDNGQLGGFEFSPSDLKVLAGWKVTSRDISMYGHISAQQTVKLSKGSGYLLVSIGVFVSAGWAHQGLVSGYKFSSNHLASVASKHNWGDLCGVDIGDVWFSGLTLKEATYTVKADLISFEEMFLSGFSLTAERSLVSR